MNYIKLINLSDINKIPGRFKRLRETNFLKEIVNIFSPIKTRYFISFHANITSFFL